MISKELTLEYDNYEAVDPKHYTPWMLEAYKTLEGIN